MKPEPLAYINGELVPRSAATLSIFDAGITGGIAVTERLRTFRHELFLPCEHIVRFFASAAAAFVPIALSPEALTAELARVTRLAAESLPQAEDLTVSMFATPGLNGRPTLCIVPERIRAQAYADQYEAGLHLVTPVNRAINPDALSPQVKSRSRMHWHIADRQAAAQDARAFALLLDENDCATETATGNLFAVSADGLRFWTPRKSRTLHGISQRFVSELVGVERVEERDLRVDDLLGSRELFVTSSVSCVHPVATLNGCSIGSGAHDIANDILFRWSRQVGVDIVLQMRTMSETPNSGGSR